MTTGPTRPGDPAAGPPPFRPPPQQPPQAAHATPPTGRHSSAASQSPSGAATVLGVGVGLFGTAIGLAVLIGGSGLFLDAAPPPDLDLSRRAALGLVLFIFGLIVLAAVMATGLIAPSAPIVGGVIATLFGLIGAIAVYLENVLARVMDTVGLPDTAQAYITSWVVTGATLTVGILMLLGGLVISATRRRTIRAAAPSSTPTAGPPVGMAPYGRQPYGPPPGGPPFGGPSGPPSGEQARPGTGGQPRQGPPQQPPLGPPAGPAPEPR